MLASLCVTLFMLASSPQVPPSVAAVAAKAALTLNNDQDDQDVPLYSSPSSNWQSPPPVANVGFFMPICLAFHFSFTFHFCSVILACVQR